MSALEQANSLVDMGYRIFPLTPLSKQPPLIKDHLNEATDDPTQIAAWVSQFGDGINWGIPTGFRNGIFAIDLDSPDAITWFNKLGFPAGAVVTTPRGGKHIVYSYSGDVEIQTNTGKFNGLHQNLDVRGDGGYIVAPGSETSSKINSKQGDGFYEGDISSPSEAPQGLIDILPKRQTFVRNKPEGDQVDSATPGEARAISRIIDVLESLPRPWHEGAFWDDTIFRMACWLGRMVNSPEYALTEDQALSILLTHSPTDEQWTDADILAKWESAQKQTANQYAESPSMAPDFVDLDPLLSKMSDPTLNDIYWESTDRKRLPEFVRGLMHDGFTDAEAHTLAFTSKPNQGDKKRSTWRMVSEIYSLQPDFDIVLGEVAAPAEKQRFDLLSDKERELLERTPNFIQRYLEIARIRLEDFNAPYHELNAWMALSCAYGGRGYIPFKRGRIPLNFYGMPIGPSASGKGDAKNQFISVLGRMAPGGWSGVSIGGDASESALRHSLIERNGEVSLFNTDEASGFLSKIHDKGGYAGTVGELITNAYDGRVEGSLRRGDPSLNGEEADNVILNLWLNGTWDGITSNLYEGDITSGWIGRFIVGIGNKVSLSAEAFDAEEQDEMEIQLGVHPTIFSIGVWSRIINGVEKGQHPVKMDPEARRAYQKAGIALNAKVQQHSEYEHLAGIFLRLHKNAWKAAALVALSENRWRIEYTDMLVALNALETWAFNAVKIVDGIKSNDWRKVVDSIYEFIKEKGAVTDAAIHRRFNYENHKIEQAVSRLHTEARIKKNEGDKKWIALSAN